jgi:hypothetical protein
MLKKFSIDIDIDIDIYINIAGTELELSQYYEAFEEFIK